MSSSPRRRPLANSPFAVPEEPVHPVYAVGDRVVHDTYGMGRVTNVESTIAVSIDFGTHNQRITLPTGKLFPL